MDKPTTSTAEDTDTKPENPTPADEDADAIFMNELGLLDGEEQSDHFVIGSSKTTDKVS
jgi:hypothetical protein